VRAQGTGPEARAALDTLIRRYEKTVELIIRSAPFPRSYSAEDLKQHFFLGFLRREDVLKLDPSRGKFRNWLHVAVRRFIKNVWAHWYTERSGNAVTAPLDFSVADSETPEQIVMQRFAADTLAYAIERHRMESSDTETFDRMARLLPGPALDLDELASIAAELGLSSNAFAVRRSRLRKRHRQVLREVVADTLDVDLTSAEGAQAVELEMRELVRVLRWAPALRVLLAEA